MHGEAVAVERLQGVQHRVRRADLEQRHVVGLALAEQCQQLRRQRHRGGVQMADPSARSRRRVALETESPGSLRGFFIAEQRYCRGLNRSRSTARKIRQCAHRAQWCLSISAFFAQTKTRADHLTSRCGCVNASCSHSGPPRDPEARRVASARLAGLIGQRCRSKQARRRSPASRRRSRRAPRR